LEEVLREKLLALAALQKVDLEVANLRKSAEGSPKQTAELEKELGAARAAAESERQKLEDVDRQKSNLEDTLTDDKDKVRKWESRLTEQRSTREYSALAREIDIAKKGQLSMAEEIQSLDKQRTAQRDVVRTRDAEFQVRSADLQVKMGELRVKLTEVEGQIKTLEEKRAEVSKSVDAGLLKRYEHIRKKRMPALVPVSAPGTCGGCRMNVPPQLYNTLRSTLGNDVCPSCQRIIYAIEAIDPPAAK
jgi:predicted  nucleic acid-binding Zn-ribbon protein